MNFSRTWEAQPSIGTSVALDWLECQWEVNIGPTLSLQCWCCKWNPLEGLESLILFSSILSQRRSHTVPLHSCPFPVPLLKTVSHISDVKRPLKWPWHSGVVEDMSVVAFTVSTLGETWWLSAAISEFGGGAGHGMHPAAVLLSGKASCFTHDKSITTHVQI